VENGSCSGVQVLDGRLLYTVQARAVVLASGGGGHLFANTTNPAQACGEGHCLGLASGSSRRRPRICSISSHCLTSRRRPMLPDL
jgi:L-aspartate oxidase